MNDRIESDIRKALDEQAYTVDVPDDLAAQTLAKAAAVDVHQPLWGRLRSRRETRRMRLPAGGYPRWLLAPAAGLAVMTLFALGVLVTDTPPMEPGSRLSATDADARNLERYNRRAAANIQPGDDDAVKNQSGTSASGDAVAGQVAGVVSSGDASVDSTNHSEDVDIETGDADGTNSASGFTGLTAGSDTTVAADILNGSRNAGSDTPQLVRTADIKVAVRNFEKAWAEANEVAADNGGAVVDTKTKQVSDRIAQGTIRMRVPSDKLEAVLADLRELGTLAQLDTSGDDISKQMADVEERTNAAEDKEKELKDLEAKATTVSERLDLQNRLEDVRKDIDNLDEKQTALRDKVDTSIVNATIFEDEVAAGKGSSILGKALDASGKLTLTILAGALVLAGALLPLALIGAAIWLVVRRLKARS